MRREYPKMLYGQRPEYVVVSCAEEEAQRVARGYSPLPWGDRCQEVPQAPGNEKPKETCPYCERRFTTKQGLATHLWKAHRGATPKLEQG